MNKEINHPHARKAVVKELRDNEVVLTFEDGQELTWPKSLLPTHLEKETELRVILHDKVTDQAEREELARTLLNEMLQIKND